MWRDSLRRIPPIGLFPVEGLGHAEGAPTRFMVASGGVLSEGYGHGGPGVCLGDGQTEGEGVPSQGGRGDALLRRMPPYLTLTLPPQTFSLQLCQLRSQRCCSFLIFPTTCSIAAEWTRYEREEYKIFVGAESFSVADRRCENRGGLLTSIANAAENQVVTDMIVAAATKRRYE